MSDEAIIGILSPGDMGHGIGWALRDHGARVVTALAGRSARTRSLAAEAGIEDLGTVDALVAAADAVLSVVVPASAVAVARDVAAALARRPRQLLYVDANAISPTTAQAVETIVTTAGGSFVDGCIIGSPPPSDGTRLYTSGPEGARAAALLSRYGLETADLGPVVGRASGLKMCYAAYTKGMQTLALEVLVAAEALGLTDSLNGTPGGIARERSRLDRKLVTVPPKAHRWVGEMEEIARTLEDLGLPGGMLAGAGEVCRWLAGTPPGRETPEERDRSRTADDLTAGLARGLPRPLVPSSPR